MLQDAEDLYESAVGKLQAVLSSNPGNQAAERACGLALLDWGSLTGTAPEAALEHLQVAPADRTSRHKDPAMLKCRPHSLVHGLHKDKYACECGGSSVFQGCWYSWVECVRAAGGPQPTAKSCC